MRAEIMALYEKYAKPDPDMQEVYAARFHRYLVERAAIFKKVHGAVPTTPEDFKSADTLWRVDQATKNQTRNFIRVELKRCRDAWLVANPGVVIL
jgi:hypothetical protein